MIAKRALALVVAVGLVFAAVAIRRNVIDGTGDDGRSKSEAFRLRCGVELAAVCQRIVSDGHDIELSVEDEGTTADHLGRIGADEDPGFDAWLAVGPWAAIVADNRRFAAGVEGEVLSPSPLTVARSRPVLAVGVSGQSRLGECEDEPTWSCVGGLPEGQLRIGVPNPNRGDGLMVLASAATSYFGGEPFDTTDLDTAAFQAWFDRLTRVSARSHNPQIPLDVALTASGTYDVVGALRSQIDPQGRSGTAFSTYPDPVVTAPVQLATPTSAEPSEALDRLGDEAVTKALAEHRYEPAPTGDGPHSDGLPAPGVLQSLRAMWPQR